MGSSNLIWPNDSHNLPLPHPGLPVAILRRQPASTRSHISHIHSTTNSHILLSVSTKYIPNLHTSPYLPHDDPSQSHHLPRIPADSLPSDLSSFTVGPLHSVLHRAVIWQQHISKMQITYNCPAQNLPTASLQIKIKHKLLSRPSQAPLW